MTGDLFAADDAEVARTRQLCPMGDQCDAQVVRPGKTQCSHEAVWWSSTPKYDPDAGYAYAGWKQGDMERCLYAGAVPLPDADEPPQSGGTS